MQFRHASGFLVMGAALAFLPRIAPGWCPPSGVDGSSARELWLHVMSWLQLGIASRYFAGRVLSALAVVMEYPPRPVQDTPSATSAREAAPATLPLPSTMLEQPAAA